MTRVPEVTEVPSPKSQDTVVGSFGSSCVTFATKLTGAPASNAFPPGSSAMAATGAESPVGAHAEKTSVFAVESSIHMTRRLPCASAAPVAFVETPGVAERFTGAPNVFPPSAECA